jgi:hypothetical protein
MRQRDGRDTLTEELKGDITPLLYRAEGEARRPWVRMVTEDVVHTSTHRVEDALLPVDGDILTPRDGTHIVQTERVVVVLVSQEDSIDTIDTETCGLVVEVWATVNEDTLPTLGDDEGRGAQTTVTSIRAMAHRAATAYLGDTSAGARTEKNYLHVSRRESYHGKETPSLSSERGCVVERVVR